MNKIKKLAVEAQDYISKGKDAEYSGPSFYFEKAQYLVDQVQKACNKESERAKMELENMF